MSHAVFCAKGWCKAKVHDALGPAIGPSATISSFLHLQTYFHQIPCHCRARTPRSSVGRPMWQALPMLARVVSKRLRTIVIPWTAVKNSDLNKCCLCNSPSFQASSCIADGPAIRLGRPKCPHTPELLNINHRQPDPDLSTKTTRKAKAPLPAVLLPVPSLAKVGRDLEIVQRNNLS